MRGMWHVHRLYCSNHTFDTCMDKFTRALLNLLWSTCRSRLDNPLHMLSHNLTAHEMRGGKAPWGFFYRKKVTRYYFLKKYVINAEITVWKTRSIWLISKTLLIGPDPDTRCICGLEASFPGPIVIFLLRERNIIDMQNARGKNSHREKNSHSYVKRRKSETSY